MRKRKLTPEQRERLRQLDAEIAEYDRKAREIFDRVDARLDARRREREERLERRRRLLRMLLPFRRDAA